MSIQTAQGRAHRQTGEVPDPPASTTARALFSVLAGVAVWIGGWAEVAPRSFYLSFPGFGRNWIAPLGPYNEHLLRDLGGLNLGLAAAAVVAAVALTRSAAICAAAAWLVYSVPHLVFHAFHTEPFTGIDNAATLASLAAPVVAPLAATVLVWRASRRL